MREKQFGGMDLPPLPEEDSDGLTPEEHEQADFLLPRYQEEAIQVSERRDCEQEVAEFEAMLAEFEARFSLEELLAIVDLTVADAPKHPLREPAKLALIPMVKLMNILGEQTSITKERHHELVERYKRLSSAVGFINGGKVRH